MSKQTIIIKAHISGQDILICQDENILNSIEYGQPVLIEIKSGITPRSLEQLNLYWACCKLLAEQMADNSDWNTKEKVSNQVKYAVKFIDKNSVTHIIQSDGTQRLYFEVKSISFSKADRQESNQFFKEAFEKMAEFLNISEKELITEVQARMKAPKICKLCGKQATDKHHLFSNTKQNRSLYGKLIDDTLNIMYLCNDCHIGGASIPKLTEKEFCKKLNIEIRSK